MYQLCTCGSEQATLPSAGYINESAAKTGYFFASFFLVSGASCLFLLNYFKERMAKHDTTVSFTTVDSHLAHEHYALPLENGGGGGGTGKPSVAPAPQVGGPVCTCGADPTAPPPPPTNPQLHDPSKAQAFNKLGKTISFATSVDVLEPHLKPELLTCISEEGLLEHYYDCVGECATSCKYDNVFFSECQDNIDFDAEDEDDEPVARPPLYKMPLHPAGRRLRQASGVSFSEPEGLARLGQGGSGGCVGVRRPHPSHEYGMPPVPRPPILRREPTSRPRRNITVIEEMTTSV